MCRKNLLFAGILIAFGTGLLLSLLIEGALLRLLLGLGGVVGGFLLLKC